MENIVEPDRW